VTVSSHNSHTSIYTCTFIYYCDGSFPGKPYIPVISAVAGSLVGPTPKLVIAVTMTTTVPLNTLSGSDGAVNISVVVELLTFIIVPL